ncbi:hypothetical protein [Methylobacterium sp. 1030]|uniref:hypothetical protein n=1 Tax=Methylobacterium sp. 1030 TaxID=3156404 RepID=UPI003394FE97
MSSEIDAMQVRLEEHFAALREARSKQGLPVFALEHGLNASELSSLVALLKTQLISGGRLGVHWLLWVVYATEQGYNYEGEEYWYTFESKMPLWDRRWRPSLRTWFEKFCTMYGGLSPEGSWAKNFSIIAWPITHALLPKDLQEQLAYALYNLRYQIVSRLDRPPAEIGGYVARMAHGGSSRFENFVEQEELVGRIILALLDYQSVDNGSAIRPDTLARIASDLEKVRSARQWLHDTRKAVEIATLRGTAPRGGTESHNRDQLDSPAKERKPSIRPSLILRRTGQDEWTPILEVPSFREVAYLNHELATFLRRTRCSVAGSTGLRPPGWLLIGAQRRTLTTWPATGKPVLSFQAPNAALEHLLSSEGRISPGPTWIFRRGSDGQAVEVLGRLVRPNRSYIFVTQGELPVLSMGAPTRILCGGVKAVQIDVPAVLTEGQIDELKKVGLSVAQTIRIWPVGLAARGWDGEGTTEWLESERPCFAVEHDHPVAEYELSLGAGPTTRVKAKPPGIATFIRLQPLPPGNHVLSVSVIRNLGSGAVSRPAEGVISLSVRPPNPWISGTIEHNGLIVGSEPPEPTLDEFWEGLTQLNVLGPAGRHVNVCVELLSGSGSRLALEQVGQLTLPLGPGSWRNMFAGFARREKDPWSYLEASSGRIIVDGEELGIVHIPLHRNLSPVRWVWRTTSKSTLLRLVDDQDADAPLEVTFHSFATPLQTVVLPPDEVAGGIEPQPPGGLVVANYADRREALVVSMRKVDGGFGGLIVEPKFEKIVRTQDQALAVLKSVVAWSDSRLAGVLASERRERVVRRLKERLYSILCGANWERAESRLELGLSTQAGVEGLLRCFGDKRVFALVLARDATKFARMPDQVRKREFAALAQRYKVAPSAPSKRALDLASVLDQALRPSDADLRSLIALLWDYPALVAGARILQLLGGQVASSQQVFPAAGVA